MQLTMDFNESPAHEPKSAAITPQPEINPASQDKSLSREELRALLRQCYETLRDGGRISAAAALSEFVKIISLKYRDELQPDGPGAFRRRNGESEERLAQRIRRLYAAEKEREPEVYRGSIDSQPSVIAKCAEHLHGISLTRTRTDIAGAAFQEFTSGFAKGDFGQYFTPRDIVAFAVELMQPQAGELILDPACGSGGFLLCALDYVRSRAGPQPLNPIENDFHGIEINDELARIAKMNMLTHGAGHGNIVCRDALAVMSPEYRNAWQNRFDLIFANPPFGGVVRRSEKGGAYLDQYEIMEYLGEGKAPRPQSRTAKKRSGAKTEILFLDRIRSMLKPATGRAAVVLPDGVLSNESLQGVRDWMLHRHQLLAVVSFPQHAFRHFDANVKTSLVMLRRRAEGEIPDDHEFTFMAIVENLGYDSIGRNTYKITAETETPGKEKTEIQSCDLFDWRVRYDRSRNGAKKSGWSERLREVVPDSGVAGNWREFLKDPASFPA